MFDVLFEEIGEELRLQEAREELKGVGVVLQKLGCVEDRLLPVHEEDVVPVVLCVCCCCCVCVECVTKPNTQTGQHEERETERGRGKTEREDRGEMERHKRGEREIETLSKSATK